MAWNYTVTRTSQNTTAYINSHWLHFAWQGEWFPSFTLSGTHNRKHANPLWDVGPRFEWLDVETFDIQLVHTNIVFYCLFSHWALIAGATRANKGKHATFSSYTSSTIWRLRVVRPPSYLRNPWRSRTFELIPNPHLDTNIATGEQQQSFLYPTWANFSPTPFQPHLNHGVLDRCDLWLPCMPHARGHRHRKKVYGVDFFAKSFSGGLTNYVIRHNSQYSSMTSLPRALCPHFPEDGPLMRLCRPQPDVSMASRLSGPVCWTSTMDGTLYILVTVLKMFSGAQFFTKTEGCINFFSRPWTD